MHLYHNIRDQFLFFNRKMHSALHLSNWLVEINLKKIMFCKTLGIQNTFNFNDWSLLHNRDFFTVSTRLLIVISSLNMLNAVIYTFHL